MSTLTELPKVLENYDTPFKISAGPGAGKTTWLVNHLQQVINNSKKLGKTKKVACITYTRIGADTVQKKVKKLTGTSRLDTGTIHSFLYRNIIKPFAYLIATDLNGDELFNVQELNGHIENRLIWDRLRSWKAEIEKDNGRNYDYFNFADNKRKLIAKLACIEYTIESNTEIKISFSKKANRYDVPIPLKNNELLKYKKSYWRKGIMHHEDVLYFTHYLFKNFPRVAEFVSYKFPYIFLDEFQDTNPLQTWIINQIATKGTTIGVIGDPAQSIFEFAGARRRDFNEFTLPKIQNFKKSKNYRSTVKIIDFLKILRDDIEQIPKTGAETGEDVVVIVNSTDFAILHLESLNQDDFAVLCRSNIQVSKIKSQIKNEDVNLITELYSEDSDHKRPTFLHALIKAYDFNNCEEYKEAVKEIMKHLRTKELNGIEKRKLAIELLDYLNSNLESSIESIYKYIQPILKKHSITMPGLAKPKKIHKNAFKDFIPFLSKQTRLSSKIKTIHQSKGDEFENVLLCLDDKTDKNGTVRKSIEAIMEDYIFNASANILLDTEIGEETRLVYVACSRARSRLFINVPRLSAEVEQRLSQMNVIVIRN